VTVFIVAPGTIANGENASYVLGQANFTSNVGSTTSQSTLANVSGLSYDANNSRLFVADTDNIRVMVLNVAPGTIANGDKASRVLGETSFTSNAGGTTQSTLTGKVVAQTGPTFAYYDPRVSHVFVADTVNNRVMIFEASSIPAGDYFNPLECAVPSR